MKSKMIKRLFALAVLVSTTSFAAEKVTVLPFGPSGTTTKEAERSAVASLFQRGFGVATESERQKALAGSKDGVFDTQAEHLAAGKASGSIWTLTGRIEPHALSYRLELEACLVSTGRVESVQREIEPSLAEKQISEMVAFLLRVEGVGKQAIPWNVIPNATQPPVTAPVTPPAPTTLAPPTPLAPVDPKAISPYQTTQGTSGMQKLAQAPMPKEWWLAGSAGVMAAMIRPTGATGNATSLALALSGGATFFSKNRDIPATGVFNEPGALEIVGNLGVGLIGPSSLYLDAGARYRFAAGQIYGGPNLALGLFYPFAGDRSFRFLMRAGGFVGFAIDEHLFVEAAPDLMFTFGGTGTLGFFSGLVRFGSRI
ncbi:MAG: hypothetical protein KBF88_02240 [Polyangiaceae bacterium]|nr:hypothetical protein [Polyangiaceae bacterium]